MFLFLGLASAQNGPFCPPIDVIGSPINIVAEYISTLFSTMDLKNTASLIGLLDVFSDSNGDMEIHRFVLQIQRNETAPASYIGIIATFPVIRSQSNRYKIEKFVQSNKLSDITFLLDLKGNLRKEDTLCNDFKFSFLHSLVERGVLPKDDGYRTQAKIFEPFIERQLGVWEKFLKTFDIFGSKSKFKNRRLLDQLLLYSIYLKDGSIPANTIRKIMDGETSRISSSKIEQTILNSDRNVTRIIRSNEDVETEIEN